MARKWTILAGAALLIAMAAAATVWTWTRRMAPAHQPAVASLSTELSVTARATVAARNVIAVQSSVEGVLDTWAVEIGESVYKDQLLARVRVPQLEQAAQQAQQELDQMQARADNLDASEMAAKLEISRAEAEKARADGEVDRTQKIYERYKNLWDLGAIARLPFEKSEKDFNDAKTAAENADKAQKTAKDRADTIAAERETRKSAIGEKTRTVEQAKAALGSGDLHSPADGIVIARQGDPGQPIDPSMKNVVEIATDLTQLQATVAPAGDVSRLHPGQTVTVQLDGQEIPGAIREIRGDEVVVDFTTSAPVTKLGGIAQVRIKF